MLDRVGVGVPENLKLQDKCIIDDVLPVYVGQAGSFAVRVCCMFPEQCVLPCHATSKPSDRCMHL